MRLAFLLVCCLASACNTSKAYVIAFESTEQLNLDDDGKPSRLHVQLYLLKKKDAFMNASFEELWSEEKAKIKLGEDLAGTQPSALGKSAELPVPITLPPTVQFVGVVGNFVAPDKTGWRDCLARDELSKVKLLFGEHGFVRKP